eukprot:SAG11_NODE_3194_length_2620_cov_2.356208_2_plen_105_part_00
MGSRKICGLVVSLESVCVDNFDGWLELWEGSVSRGRICIKVEFGNHPSDPRSSVLQGGGTVESSYVRKVWDEVGLAGAGLLDGAQVKVLVEKLFCTLGTIELTA